MTSSPSVAEALRRKLLGEIGSGALPPGSRLGSERELAERYAVSRSTLRKVLATLEEADLVHRVAGRTGGTFVSHAKVERDLSTVLGVPAYLSRQGYASDTRVLSARITAADDQTRSALTLAGTDFIIEIQRVRLADDIPFSLDLARFPAERFPGLLELPLGGSIYRLLEETFDVVPSDAQETIEVVHATDEEARFLGVSVGAALLSIVRTTFDQAGEPFEYSYDLLRADRTRITMRTPGRGVRATSHPEAHFVSVRPLDIRRSEGPHAAPEQEPVEAS